METVTLERTIEAPESAVRELVTDVEPFMAAAEFDEVTVDGAVVEITNSVGLLTIELTLRVLDTEDALAYEQVEGIFEEMVTRYTIEPVEDDTSERSGGTGDGERVLVRARTEYALDVDVVGPILDGTIIARQRRRELEAQFDYLERKTREYSGTDESGP